MMIKKIGRGEDLEISLSNGSVVSKVYIERASEGRIAIKIDAPPAVRIATQSKDKAKVVE